MAKRTGQREDRNDATRRRALSEFRCSNPGCVLSAQSLAEDSGALLALRDELLQAIEGIEAVVRGLEGEAPATAGPANMVPSFRDVKIQAQGAGFGALLDFQERITGLPGVARVSISAVDSQRATLDVTFDEAAR
jgi:hypothetical protein